MRYDLAEVLSTTARTSPVVRPCSHMMPDDHDDLDVQNSEKDDSKQPNIHLCTVAAALVQFCTTLNMLIV